MERWKMHKLGFVHFWLYEREEFLLDDGHLLLRGENGSGKSITTQSFIPFILDGNMDPVRLDPFGSRARRMQYYLLGDDEREESTGYLYLEFRKPDVREYLTIGIGLRARKNQAVGRDQSTGRSQPVDFWGFCLHDGRRVGMEDGCVPLYKRAGDQWLPLSKRELKKYLADSPDCWAEAQKEYKAMVNRRVFQFRDIRQYDQLISLLIKIRAPKLTRSALLPSAVVEILNESLQVLTDDDLTSMVAAMKRMDDHKSSLEGFRASMKDAQIIRTEYNRYNRAVLGQKAKAFLDAHRRADQCRGALEQSQRRRDEYERRLQEETGRYAEAVELLDTARRALDDLGEDDVSETQKKLEDVKERLRALAAQEAQVRENLKKAEEQAERQQDQLQRKRAELENSRLALHRAVKTLTEINGILDLGVEHEAYVRAVERMPDDRAVVRMQVDRAAERMPDDRAAERMPNDRAVVERRDAGPFRTVRGALQRRRAQIETVLRLLEEASRLKETYDRACAELDQAEIRAARAEKQARDAEEVEREERDRLVEAFANWTADCTQLSLAEEERLSIRRDLSRYQTPADWTPIRDRVDNCGRTAALALEQRRTRAEGMLEQRREEEREQQRKLDYLKSLGEAVPPRREQVEATRNMLALRGIPCAPFYQTVDFAPDLPPARRALLEAQLRDAGLLDALVVPTACRAELEDLLAQSPDTFLLPGPAVEDPALELVPDRLGQFQEEAARILRGISRSDREAETALLPDGYFRCGAVRGYSAAEDAESGAGRLAADSAARHGAAEYDAAGDGAALSAGTGGFIGAEARRRRLKAQIQNEEAHLAVLTEAVREKETEIASVGQMLDLLDREWKAMPSAAELDQALNILHDAERERDSAQKERAHAAAAEQDAKRRKGETDRKCREESTGLPYQLEIPFYEEARDQALEYGNTLADVQNQRNAADSCAEQVRAWEDSSQVLSDSVDAFRRNQDAVQREQRQTETRRVELQAWLDRPENQERARRLEELRREIRKREAERQDADKQCAILTEKLQGERDSLSGLHAEVLDAEDAEKKREAYFQEDLNLGFSGLDPSRPPVENARSAWKQVPETDQNRPPLSLANTLINLCQTHGSTLLKYNLECSPVFEDRETDTSVLRSRYCVTLRWREARLSLFDFIRQLQDSMDTVQTLLTDSDRDLFENILTQTVSQTLRARIDQSEQWTKNMGDLMRGMRTSMGLVFSLEWTPRKGETPEELDTEEIVRILRKDAKMLTPEDNQKAAAHFRAKFNRSRDSADTGVPMEYADMIRDALDYRKWYQFRLFFRRPEQDRKPLTDSAFNRFSGGEKAMAVYVPLFAALSAQYGRAASFCPLLLALDEAFAGVDEQNIAAMFELAGALDFDYIMNSQALWGCYECVKNLDIAELHTSAAERLLVVIRYHWDGKERVLLEIPERGADAGGKRK